MPDENENKIMFAVPDTNEEPPIFLGFVFAATRSKGKIEKEIGQPGPGEPLYSAYVFPFAPTDEQKKSAGDAEQPLFVSYIYPFHAPGDVVLGGGGAGGVSALGGIPGGEILFYSRIVGFSGNIKKKGEED